MIALFYWCVFHIALLRQYLRDNFKYITLHIKKLQILCKYTKCKFSVFQKFGVSLRQKDWISEFSLYLLLFTIHSARKAFNNVRSWTNCKVIENTFKFQTHVHLKFMYFCTHRARDTHVAIDVPISLYHLLLLTI